MRRNDIICVVCVIILLHTLVNLLILHRHRWVRTKRESHFRIVHERDWSPLVSCKSVRCTTKRKAGKSDMRLTCITLGSSTTVTFIYNSFSMDPPLFITQNSSKLFYLSQTNRDFLGKRQHNKMIGKLYIVRGGTYDLNNDCGYKSQPNDIIVGTPVKKEHSYHIVTPIFTPESWTFQHFLDGALPKLIQSIEILHRYNVTLLFEYSPRDELVYEILETLNFSTSRVAYREKVTIYAAHLFFTCITPPLHPFLWQKARRLIGVPEVLQMPMEDAHVVFVTRNGCFNCGRKIQNRREVIKMLKQRYGTCSVKVFYGNLTLAESIDMFGKARIIMGAHGGGLYNINFAPSNTAVVEFMPTYSNGTMMASSKTIIWAQSKLLGQIYWRMCLEPIPDTLNDMTVPVDDLESILDVVDERNKTEQ